MCIRDRSDALPALPDRHQLLAELLIALAAILDRFAQHGFAGLQVAWQSRHAWQGQPVRVLDGTNELSGRCLGADCDGALLLETDAGTQRLLSGDLSLRQL